MENYIADGEIHAISKEWAYILKEIDEIKIDETDLKFNKLRTELYEKYSQYLYDFDKEKVMEIIFEYMCKFLFNTPEDFCLIYRPEFGKNKATFALKFKRSDEDNL